MPSGEQLSPHLPLLRRFARALTGDQADGDAIVRATLESLVEDSGRFPDKVEPRIGLFKMFLDQMPQEEDVRLISSAPLDTSSSFGIAHKRLSGMTKDERRALLLTAMEGFTTDETGYLLSRPAAGIDRLVASALAQIEEQTRTCVLIIEDNPMIARELETVVLDLGHEVTGITTTRRDAVQSARQNLPGLIIADVQLRDNSSGIDAVQDINGFSNAPCIFITAHPERLLAGERPQPVFMITKPFQRSTIKAAISQALFFHDADATSVEPLPFAEQWFASDAEDGGAIAVPERRGETILELAVADLSALPAPIDVEWLVGS